MGRPCRAGGVGRAGPSPGGRAVPGPDRGRGEDRPSGTGGGLDVEELLRHPRMDPRGAGSQVTDLSTRARADHCTNDRGPTVTVRAPVPCSGGTGRTTTPLCWSSHVSAGHILVHRHLHAPPSGPSPGPPPRASGIRRDLDTHAGQPRSPARSLPASRCHRVGPRRADRASPWRRPPTGRVGSFTRELLSPGSQASSLAAIIDEGETGWSVSDVSPDRPREWSTRSRRTRPTSSVGSKERLPQPPCGALSDRHTPTATRRSGGNIHEDRRDRSEPVCLIVSVHPARALGDTPSRD
jgi:hypothetical protein